MKISKVNHTRAAVTKVNGTVEGILYEHPSEKAKVDLGERINELNRKAQILYNVLNQPKPDDDISKNTKFFLRDFNRIIKEALKTRNFNRKNIENGLSELNINSNEVNKLATLYLRKSLVANKDGFVALVKKNCCQKNISAEEDKAINDFLNAILADYKKTDFKEKVKKSIQNQNLVVQTNGKDSELISLSQNKNSNSRKSREKEGLNNFLSNYANLDEKERNKQLVIIRRILSVYFEDCSNIEDVLDNSLFQNNSDIDVWSDHVDGKHMEGFFVTPPDVSVCIVDGKWNNAKAKGLKQNLNDEIRQKNISCYRASTNFINAKREYFFDDENTNAFFVHHIEQAVERILDGVTLNKAKLSYKLSNAYLKENVWKDILNFISIKYIALGKAVYHFGMNDLNRDSDDKSFGNITENAIDGLSSFDYEQIKAKETLQREMATYIAFSANNLARATVNIPYDSRKMEDFLVWNVDKIRSELKYKDDNDATLKAILQFFGGMSTWDKSIFEKAYGDSKEYEILFLNDIRKLIYSLRNQSFHFTTRVTDTKDVNHELINRMFEHELLKVSDEFRNRFYSNNLPMFYSAKNLERVLNTLHSAVTIRQTQVPSFNSVFVRNNFIQFARNDLKIRLVSTQSDVEAMYIGALYYLCKEIYYNDFIGNTASKEYFYNAITKLMNSNEYKNDKQKNLALSAFSARCNSLNQCSLSEICQQIMTEYNYQNSSIRKVSTGKKSETEKFKNYKMLLLKVLEKAFADYIKKNSSYAFIFNPSERPLPPKEDFIPNWKAEEYDSLLDTFKKNDFLKTWYIACHFINGRSLSMLSGSVKSYIQYNEDVIRRAKQTGTTLVYDESANIAQYKKVVSVIEICTMLSSTFSNEFKDYFRDDDEYASFVLNYYDIPEYNNLSSSSRLQQFVRDTELVGFYDEQNPILNRNIVMAKLYGATNVLNKVINPVNSQAIGEYNSLKEEIANYNPESVLSTDEKRKNLKYQQLKNKVELNTVVEFGEITNELLGQLLNWSYLRERDLLYFQLGFHYMCLKNSTFKPTQYINLIDENTKIDGAILYQIASMYIYGVPMYSLDESGKVNKMKENLETSAKIGGFLKYSDVLLKNTPLSSYSKVSIYNAGLEVFENINEHDSIVDIRNSIDHFKYYSGEAGSILDLYSEVFDRFFTYDMKYKKNVGNLLSNILARHFVKIGMSFTTSTKAMDNGSTKPRAMLALSERGTSSTTFTFKVKDGTLEIDARDKDYLITVCNLLNAFSKEGLDDSNGYVSEERVDKFKEKKKEDSNTDNKSNFNNRNGNTYKNNNGYENHNNQGNRNKQSGKQNWNRNNRKH